MSGLANVVDVGLQVAVLGGIVWLVERGCRGSAPLWCREFLWSAVLLRLLLPPELPAWAAFDGAFGVVPGLHEAVVGEALAGADGAWVVAVWGLGAIGFAAVGLRRYLQLVRALRRDSQPAAPAWRRAAVAAGRRFGLRRLPRLRAVPWLAGPCVVGLWSPTVYVPLDFGDRTPRDREHALLHEFAHVARRDPLRAAFALAALVFAFWHPMAWLAAARLRLVRELACDAIAAGAAAGGAVAYRATLLGCAEAVLRRQGWLPVPGLVGAHELLPRLQALVDGRRARTGKAVVAVGGLLACSCWLATPAPTPAFHMPTVAEAMQLPGCFPTRYAVFTALAEAEASAAAR